MKAGRPAYHIRARFIQFTGDNGKIQTFELDRKGQLIKKDGKFKPIESALAIVKDAPDAAELPQEQRTQTVCNRESPAVDIRDEIPFDLQFDIFDDFALDFTF